jgi:CheY-like chemotaxis protein
MNHPSSSPPRLASSLALELRFPDEEKSLRILLAEDNHQLRRLMSFVLRREGHEVVEVQDGGALLEMLAISIVEGARQRFDLVICEQLLPRMPGLAVLAGLRARDHDLPFILITGNSELQAQARQLGAWVLSRPLTMDAIRRAVRQTEDELRGKDEGPVALAARRR